MVSVAAAAVRWAREEPELHDDRGAVRQLGALRAVGERVDGDDEDDGDVELARVDGGGLDCSQPALATSATTTTTTTIKQCPWHSRR